MQICEDSETSPVVCKLCRSQVGQWDAAAGGVRLFKPCLALDAPDSSQYGRPTTAQWLSCFLLDLIDSTGVRKFYGQNSTLTLWVFSPHVTYASSSQGGTPTPAMKVFFKQEAGTPGNSSNEKLNAKSLQIEALSLPKALEKALVTELQKAHKALPQSLRLFQDWNVAYLDRMAA